MYKLLFITFLFLPVERSGSQITVYLPPEISIELNSSVKKITAEERAKLLKKAANADINYTTVGMQFETTESIVKIMVPQTFDTTGLIEQCLIYFSFLGSEKKMAREILLVYPFFDPIDEPPPVICTYSGNGRYKIKIRDWITIPMPESPSGLEAEIFNMVLDQAFTGSQNFESIPDEVFENVARQNDIDRSIVEEIYKKVLLWQKSR